MNSHWRKSTRNCRIPVVENISTRDALIGQGSAWEAKERSQVRPISLQRAIFIITPTFGMARLNVSDQIKFDELLIEEIKSYPFLFSTKDPRHRDPELKKTTYMKIAQSLNSGKPFHNFVS